jgi:hypothetical protein
LDNSLIKTANASGTNPGFDEWAGDKSPFAAGFLKVLIDGEPVSVDLGSDLSKVLKL